MATPYSPGQPPVHAKLLAISNKMRKQVDEIEKTVAQSLGYCYAGMQPNMMQQLSQVLDKMKGLHIAIKEIDIVKSEVSDMVSQLKKLKREHADLFQERQVLLTQLVDLNAGLEDDDFTEDENKKAPEQEHATPKKESAQKTEKEAESDVHMEYSEEENHNITQKTDMD